MHPPVGFKEDNPLNNNNRGSNRRRGRGNNRQQGGNQGNRIDSRARGNAPQLLEKYKKLAHDASLNGDRVQAEYYLQFADHYFRVLADSRTQKDEPRGPRRDGERDQGYDTYDRDDEPTPANGAREPRDRDDDRAESDEFEPSENPFTRDNRSRRNDGEHQSRGRGRTSDDEAREELRTEPRDDSRDGDDNDAPRFDPASLPPSFSSDAEEERPRRKPRKPRAEKSDDRGDEELETVN